jgi:hypothetical protein
MLTPQGERSQCVLKMSACRSLVVEHKCFDNSAEMGNVRAGTSAAYLLHKNLPQASQVGIQDTGSDIVAH